MNYLRSFFQQSNDNKSRYVMHDLINDLARSVSKDTAFHLIDNEPTGEESYEYIRHSSFIPCVYNISRRFNCFYQMLKLRTFLSLLHSYYGRSYLSKKVLYDLLPKLQCLRVLSLTTYGIEELPSCVGELKQLRYLDLSSTLIRRLLESIGKLFHLETLKLRGCSRLIELPKSIYNLTNLLYLDITWTDSLKEMPPQIGNLTSLRMLSKFIVGEENDGLKISELKKLSQLAGKIEIKGLQNVGDIKDENLIKENPALVELYLEWHNHHTVVNSNIQDEETLKSLEPHQNASIVSISGFGGRQFPSWVGDPKFSKMVKLELLSCEHIKLLPPLGRLPSLKELRIQGFSAVQEVGSEFYGDDSSFPCLESLEIQDMSEWKQWSWCNTPNEDSMGKFHKLRKLVIRNCPKLVGTLPSFLPCLEQFEISGCHQLTDIPGVLPSLKKLSSSGCREAVLRNLTNVPCLTWLIIERMEGLLTLYESYLQAMAALQKLEISECSELECLLADGTYLDYLTNVKHLKISGCEELVSLVKEFLNGPNNLQSLFIRNCPSLEVVLCDSVMSSLETLGIQGCKSVSCYPNGEIANSLKFLTIGKGAKQLLESFHYGFSHLTDLSIDGCDELESFPNRELPSIPTLVSLKLRRCKSLKSLSNHMKGLHNLQSLSIRDCDELESFLEGGLPNSILSLKIDSCSRLRYLPNQIQNLTFLHITKIEVSSLAGFLPPKLTQLEIYDCKKLSQPVAEWGLHTLTSLGRLTIALNTDTVSFPPGLLPTSLTFLQIFSFKNVKSISMCIQNLISLQELYIFDCPKLESFPVESLPPALEYLDISDCPHLQDWCSKDRGEYGPIISYENCEDSS